MALMTPLSDDVALSVEELSLGISTRLDLDNFEDVERASYTKHVINSPRSLRACNVIGVRPIDLLPRSLFEFQQVYGPVGYNDETVRKEYQRYEHRRRQQLKEARAIRNDLRRQTEPSKRTSHSELVRMADDTHPTSNGYDVQFSALVDCSQQLTKLSLMDNGPDRPDSATEESFRRPDASFARSNQTPDSNRLSYKRRIAKVENDIRQIEAQIDEERMLRHDTIRARQVMGRMRVRSEAEKRQRTSAAAESKRRQWRLELEEKARRHQRCLDKLRNMGSLKRTVKSTQASERATKASQKRTRFEESFQALRLRAVERTKGSIEEAGETRASRLQSAAAAVSWERQHKAEMNRSRMVDREYERHNRDKLQDAEWQLKRKRAELTSLRKEEQANIRQQSRQSMFGDRTIADLNIDASLHQRLVSRESRRV